MRGRFVLAAICPGLESNTGLECTKEIVDSIGFPVDFLGSSSIPLLIFIHSSRIRFYKLIDRAMKDTALYEHLLGLKTPWSVKKVDLSLADQRVVVEVVLKKGQVWSDPTDATKRAHINGWTEREWRHLDTCQFETLIKARVPQLKYSDGTVEELVVPWAERYSRVTTLMTG
jgi:hypothetical protein